MTDPQLLQELGSHPFLHGLTEAQLARVAECAHRITVPTDEFLVRERQAADTFYLLQAGRVAIEVHSAERGNVRIQTIGPGELIGWSWLVPPHCWQFDARVVDAVRAIAIDGPALRDRCDQDHELGYLVLKQLVGVIAGRLGATRLQLLDLYR